MKKRLLRFIFGLLLALTLVITIVPNLLIWVATGESFLDKWATWCLTGKMEKNNA